MVVRSSAPVEADGELLQAVRLLQSGGHTIAVTTSSARNTTGFDALTRLIEVFADADMWIAQGDGTVTVVVPGAAPQSGVAGFLPANVGRIYALGGDKLTQYTHIAAIVASGSGILYISELE